MKTGDKKYIFFDQGVVCIIINFLINFAIGFVFFGKAPEKPLWDCPALSVILL